MLLLTSTSDIIRIVTASAVSTITVDASYMTTNAAGTTITPGSTITNITTAATTTVAAAPTGTDKINVLSLSITNNHASTACAVTVQKYNGTIAADLIGVTLLAGENLILDEGGDWNHHDTQGARYNYTGPQAVNLGIAGTLSETIPRELCTETNTTMAVSGTLNMQAIYLWAGQLVSSITLSSATTAAGTPTNYRFGLFDGSRNLLAESANQTTTAWAANTVKTLAMGTPYRVPVSGLYYIGYYMTATTVPTIKGQTARTGGQLAGTAPILGGSSSTGLTTANPNPAAAITAGTITFWAAVT
jgi:hypothetical protein